jgi:crotonobetainyl-CoA:carnitine CoA-transferase CaiB-like acyl-CoA transferase
MGSAHTSVVPYGAIATRDGHVIIAVFERFWPGFCRAAGHGDWITDPRFASNADRVANRALVMSLIEATFATRTTDAWLERLQAEGVPAAPIQTVDRVLSDPQVRHRGMVVELEHERLGRIPTLGTPIKVEGAGSFTVTPPPRLGEHTDQVLATLLKYPGERIDALRRQGVIA